MKNRLNITLLLVLSICLLAACKSSKTVTGPDSGLRLKGEDLLEAVIANTPVFDSFSSRLKLTMPTNKGEFSLNGYLKMQRNELIQISLLVPILRSEAVRVEISPEKILVIDRMNKRYADVPVEELYALFGTGMDFSSLQSLFSNAFFLPGKSEFKRRDFSSFNATSLGEDRVLLMKRDKKFEYSFIASRVSNRLVSSEIEVNSSGYSLNWQYGRFIEAGSTTFPSDMQLILRNQRKSAKVGMELSKISVDKQTLNPSATPAKYQPVTLSEILEKIKGE